MNYSSDSDEPAASFVYGDSKEESSFTDRDAAFIVLPDIDYDSQLLAIRQLLHRHGAADKELRKEMDEIEEFAKRTKGIRNERAVDEWGEHFQMSVYQDAAHSMAAVGMLAPLVESIFFQGFAGIRKNIIQSPIPNDHRRWSQAADDQWDCHFVWSKGQRKEDLVAGILQLAEAVELTPFLPPHLNITLQALFEYRNRMFHCGLEWPLMERERFLKRIADSTWPSEWFSQATRDGRPWIFYLSPEFIDHCIGIVEKVIDGMGAFCKQKYNP